MAPADTVALVALLRQARRPWPQYSELLEQGESPLHLLERELGERDDGQATLLPVSSGELPLPINRDERLERAATDVCQWERQGMSLLTVLDPDYPNNLRAVHDRPPLLFLAGTLAPQDARSVAVVGSRRASAAGRERAQTIARHLVTEGYTVVSGLAAGIDTAAHSSTLTAHGRTVAVIGTGLEHSYPAENAQLQRTITERGAVVSQFWPDAPPSRQSFPMRNAVMSGVAQGTVIVEASPTSGARIQARLALAHGRPVFVSTALLSQGGTRELTERPGVYVFAEPREITEVLTRLAPSGALVV